MGMPGFTDEGLLPPGDYGMTFPGLRGSLLVTGPGESYPGWDSEWRLHLVENLEVMVRQLWEVGITEVFADGSFVEDKDHPNDIDGYFECDVRYFATGQLERDLNALDENKVWTWNHRERRPYRNYPKSQLPMWHVYRVELYPHYPGARTGIKDRFGNDKPFPSAFRERRETDEPKGIVKLLKE